MPTKTSSAGAGAPQDVACSTVPVSNMENLLQERLPVVVKAVKRALKVDGLPDEVAAELTRLTAGSGSSAGLETWIEDIGIAHDQYRMHAQATLAVDLNNPAQKAALLSAPLHSVDQDIALIVLKHVADSIYKITETTQQDPQRFVWQKANGEDVAVLGLPQDPGHTTGKKLLVVLHLMRLLGRLLHKKNKPTLQGLRYQMELRVGYRPGTGEMRDLLDVVSGLTHLTLSSFGIKAESRGKYAWADRHGKVHVSDVPNGEDVADHEAEVERVFAWLKLRGCGGGILMAIEKQDIWEALVYHDFLRPGDCLIVTKGSASFATRIFYMVASAYILWNSILCWFDDVSGAENFAAFLLGTERLSRVLVREAKFLACRDLVRGGDVADYTKLGLPLDDHTYEPVARLDRLRELAEAEGHTDFAEHLQRMVDDWRIYKQQGVHRAMGYDNYRMAKAVRDHICGTSAPSE